MPNTRNSLWLHRAYYQETLKVYAKVWDVYIKFYTVFLTANVAGLGIVLKYLPQKERWPLAAVFVLENVVTTGTSWFVAKFSIETDDKLSDVAKVMLANDTEETLVSYAVVGSPVARKLSARAGYANCFACLLHICFWIAICCVPGLPEVGDNSPKIVVVQPASSQTTPSAAPPASLPAAPVPKSPQK